MAAIGPAPCAPAHDCRSNRGVQRDLNVVEELESGIVGAHIRHDGSNTHSSHGEPCFSARGLRALRFHRERTALARALVRASLLKPCIGCSSDPCGDGSGCVVGGCVGREGQPRRIASTGGCRVLGSRPGCGGARGPSALVGMTEVDVAAPWSDAVHLNVSKSDPSFLGEAANGARGDGLGPGG